MTSEKRAAALLYGLNYAAEPRMRLNGCWNDAIGMSSLLTASPYDFDPDTVETIMDTNTDGRTRCGRSEMLSALARLSRQSREGAGLDVAVVTYSGHGSHQRDLNGDEADGEDEGICPVDCMQKGMIIDDDLLKLLLSFNPRTRLYLVFDCCHSGSMLDLPHVFPEGVSAPDCAARLPAEHPEIVMISGCRDEQTSADAYNLRTRQFGGALTMSLLKVLQTPGSHRIGLCDLHAQLLSLLKADGYAQYPLISSTRPITNETAFFM